MQRREAERDAATDTLAESFYEMGFSPLRAERMAERIASLGDMETDVLDE